MRAENDCGRGLGNKQKAEKQIPHPSAKGADGIRDDSEREALRDLILVERANYLLRLVCDAWHPSGDTSENGLGRDACPLGGKR
jgi:hypothetical protein